MTETESSMRVAFLVANEGIEEAELLEPWRAVEDAGWEPVLIAPHAGQAETMRHLDHAGSVPVDDVTNEAQPAAFGALVLPGGVTNADALRTDAAAVRFAKAIADAGKPVAVICHGPWTLVEGDLVRGRTLTSWPSLRTDIANAGGRWVDEEVQLCEEGPGPLVSSRKPADLPAFCRTFVEVFARQRAAL